jgi:DNA gyrase inhibitor
VRRVELYIDEHYAEPLDLDALAAVACLSRFRFSRVFAAQTGETVMERLARVRVERAAAALAAGDGKVADIAFGCGFGSLSAFNAAFRSRTGFSPRQFRKEGNIPLERGKDSRESKPSAAHTRPSEFARRVLDMNVRVIELPAMDIAYVERRGDLMEARPAWDRLLAWAADKGLAPSERQFISMSDDPTLVPPEDCRFYACVSLPDGFERDGHDVEYDRIEGGLYAIYDFYDRPDRIIFGYAIVIKDFLPQSDYEQDSARPCYEANLNDPSRDPEGKCRLKLCVPLRPRSA